VCDLDRELQYKKSPVTILNALNNSMNDARNKCKTHNLQKESTKARGAAVPELSSNPEEVKSAHHVKHWQVLTVRLSLVD